MGCSASSQSPADVNAVTLTPSTCEPAMASRRPEEVVALEDCQPDDPQHDNDPKALRRLPSIPSNSSALGRLKRRVSSSYERRRSGIGAPTQVTHVGHVGWSPATGFELNGLPPAWKAVFKAAGVRKRDLVDPETSKLIVLLIAENALEAQRQGLPSLPGVFVATSNNEGDLLPTADSSGSASLLTEPCIVDGHFRVTFVAADGPLSWQLSDTGQRATFCVCKDVTAGSSVAAKGVRVGDMIVAVGDEPTDGWDVAGVSALIQSAGRPVTITLARPFDDIETPSLPAPEDLAPSPPAPRRPLPATQGPFGSDTHVPPVPPMVQELAPPPITHAPPVPPMVQELAPPPITHAPPVPVPPAVQGPPPPPITHVPPAPALPPPIVDAPRSPLPLQVVVAVATATPLPPAKDPSRDAPLLASMSEQEAPTHEMADGTNAGAPTHRDALLSAINAGGFQLRPTPPAVHDSLPRAMSGRDAAMAAIARGDFSLRPAASRSDSMRRAAAQPDTSTSSPAIGEGQGGDLVLQLAAAMAARRAKVGTSERSEDEEDDDW